MGRRAAQVQKLRSADPWRQKGADWSDEKVAQKLGFPRAWITRVREFTFGTKDTNEHAQRKDEDIQRLETLYTQTETVITDQLKLLRAEIDRVKNRISFK